MTDEKFNAAVRISKALAKVQSSPADNTLVSAWCSAYGVELNDHHEQERYVSRLLGALYDQCNLVVSLMEEQGVPQDLVMPGVLQIRSMFEVRTLHLKWSAMKPRVRPQDTLSLDWCIHSLPDEGTISDEEFNELTDSIAQLREADASSSLPASIKLVIQGVVEDLSDALAMYSVQGIVAVNKAVNHSVGSAISNMEVLNEHKDKEEVKMTGRLIVEAKSVVDKISYGNKAIETGKKVMVHGQQAIEFLRDVFPDS